MARLKLPNRTQRAERAAKFSKLLNEQDEMPIRLGWHAGYKAALRDVHKALKVPAKCPNPLHGMTCTACGAKLR